MPESGRRSSWTIRRGFTRSERVPVGAALAFLVALQLAQGARAQTPDTADIAEGMRLFLQKGNCQACHGWAGDGRKMDSQMPDGANLRETKLDRGDLIVALNCGRPGRRMPAFDKPAYSDPHSSRRKPGHLKSAGMGL